RRLFDQASGGKTVSSSLVSMLDYRRLLPENRDYTRLLQRGTPGIMTEIPGKGLRREKKTWPRPQISSLILHLGPQSGNDRHGGDHAEHRGADRRTRQHPPGVEDVVPQLASAFLDAFGQRRVELVERGR